MEKVYLLLRNNCEAGPYTYEELLQQHLLPTDLIWIEGRSTTWMCPSEIKKEEPYPQHLPAEKKEKTNSLTAAPSNEIPWYHKRRSPEAELEAKALALREQAVAAAAAIQYRQRRPSRSIEPIKHKPIILEEDAPILLEIHRVNKKTVTFPQLIAAGVITALLSTGWYNWDKLAFVRPQASLVTQAATPVIFQVIPPPAPKAVTVPVADSITEKKADSSNVNLPIRSVAVTPKKPAIVENETVASATSVQSITPLEEVKKKEETVVLKNAPVVEDKQVTEAKMDPQTTSETISSEPAKKKGLGQALKNIFKKKKKADDTTVE